MKRPRVLFYVQYLEGIGHVVRAKRIAEELVAKGCEITLVLGGNEIPGFHIRGATIRQLPPLSASPASYSKLLKADGSPVDESYKADRRDRLLEIFDAVKPGVLITEAYPMGRWAMHFELEPLLAKAAAAPRRPLIIASLRDILQMPKDLRKAERSIELFKLYYDHMLVHGDPSVVRVEDSFPPIAECLSHARYTGIVAPETIEQSAPKGETFDVIVSAGGGAIAYEVLASAITAKTLSSMNDARWLALAGPRMTDEAFDKLQSLATNHNVTLERYRSGMTRLMAAAQLSIQRAGYNTVAELLQTQCRAVLIPDAADRQMEQPLRAAKLQALGRATVLAENTLTPENMANAINQVIASDIPPINIDLRGALKSAEIICDLVASHQLSQDTPQLKGGSC